MKLFTIGFTKKNAEDFFTRLQRAGVRRVVDIRLNNTSQLAGFAKADDLKYFLKAIANIDYVYMPELCPTQDILDAFKKSKGSWNDYERSFNLLIESRNISGTVPRELLDDVEMAAMADSAASVEIVRMVTEGTPFYEIARHADELAVDAVVIAKTGQRDAREGLFFGSTAEKVVRACREPVIVLTHDA